MKFEVVKLDENLVSIKLFKDENVDKAEYVARFIFNDLKGSIITVRKQTTKYVQLLFKGNVKDAHELMYAICEKYNAETKIYKIVDCDSDMSV